MRVGVHVSEAFALRAAETDKGGPCAQAMHRRFAVAGRFCCRSDSRFPAGSGGCSTVVLLGQNGLAVQERAFFQNIQILCFVS